MSGAALSDAALAAELERIEAERERRRATVGGRDHATLSILAVAVGATLLEAFLLFLLYEALGPAWIAGLIHAVVIALLALAAWKIRPNGGHSRYLVLLFVTTFFLGIFGPLGTMLAMLLHVQFRRNATPFEEWYASLFPDHFDAPSEKLYEMLTRGLADSAKQENVTSFTDVLQYGSIEQKRAVISLLTRDFKPEFAPALQSALSDSNPAVRVQAATAAASIENAFLERAMELEQAAKASPGDTEALLAVARHFDNYAFSGILDGDRQAENRRRAEETYKAALELDPRLADAMLGVGRLMVRIGRLEEAARWFESAFARGVLRPSELAWYMEAVFRLGDFDRLRYAVAGFGDDLLADNTISDRLRDVILAWQGVDPTRELEEADRAAATAEGHVINAPSTGDTGAAAGTGDAEVRHGPH
jgi:tetratricopeptide (TPR) repeat protein